MGIGLEWYLKQRYNAGFKAGYKTGFELGMKEAMRAKREAQRKRHANDNPCTEVRNDDGMQ